MQKVITDIEIIKNVISSFARTTDEIFTLEELKKALSSGKQLKIKYGVDVTAPNMHIGHAVNLWMMRQLQELGHKVIFLIGDFTTQIGDPTGKSKTRPIIPIEEINQNAEKFIQQATMVLHDDPDLMEIRKNSEWLDKMPTKEFLKLLTHITHSRLMSREMFRKRLKDGDDIYMHETTYPILQGYDSVALKSDLTIVGSDQLYNEMIGRFYQEKFEQQPQIIITTKITPGIDGKEKQSKSLGNYIGLDHSPKEKFGRVMSIPDNLIVQYLEVYTLVSTEEIEKIRRIIDKDPMTCKLFLAKEIVKKYHGDTIAESEAEWFRKTFSKKQAPDDAEVIHMGVNSIDAFSIIRKCMPVEDASNTQLRRLFQQSAIRIDGDVISDINHSISILPQGVGVKIGKRKWFRVLF